jgi:broad specificity phosphatase PhoE
MRRRDFLAAALAAPLLVRAARDDDALGTLLANGGMVLLMRHASTGADASDPPGYNLEDCATQRNLSDPGRAQARRMGERLREMRVPIDHVYTSPWCRCRETARLAFYKSDDWAPLGSFFDHPELEAEATEHVRKRILSYSIRKPKGNVVMVTHNVNIAALTKLSLSPADIVVVQPDGCCALKVAGRLFAER